MIFCTGGKKKRLIYQKGAEQKIMKIKEKKVTYKNVKDLYLWNLYLGRYLIKLQKINIDKEKTITYEK